MRTTFRVMLPLLVGLVCGVWSDADEISAGGETGGGPLTEWAVVRIRIPRASDLADGYVDLKAPNGRVVTLTRGGEASRDGVRVAKLEWAGTPVRAMVGLRKGGESRELSVEPGLISKDETLTRRKPVVQMEMQLVEIDPAVAKTLSIPQEAGMPLPLGTMLEKGVAFRVQGVLTVKQRASLEAALRQRPEVLITQASQKSGPGGEYAPFKLLHDVQGEKGPGDASGKGSPHRAGMIIGASATAVENGTIDLEVRPQFVEYAAAEAEKGPSGAAVEPKPIFSTRSVQTSVSILGGQSLILSGSEQGEAAAFKEAFPPGKIRFLIITGTLPELEEPLK